MRRGTGAALSALALVVGLSTTHPGPVSAQDAEQRTALARSLFQEGLAAVAQDAWDVAADRFRRVLDLRPSPQVRMNLALALIELRRFVEASEHLRAVQGDTSAPAPIRAQASETLPTVLPRIGRLTVRVLGSTSGTTLSLDDHPLLDAAIGVATPIDPGTHTVAARRGADTVATQSVEVAEGASAEVTLQMPLPRVVDTPAPATAPAPGEGRSVLDTWWFWTIVAGVVVTGTAVAIVAATSRSDDPSAVLGNASPGRLDVMVMP